jgi:hypothetical protein
VIIRPHEGKERFFHDKHGNLTLFLPPNPPLIGWLASLLASWVVSGSSIKTDFSQLSRLFLFTWAYLEIVHGTSYFRQLLGVVIMVVVLMGVFSQ